MKQPDYASGTFAAVEEYFSERARLRGDLYGWGPVQSEPYLVARLLADPSALDLPVEIGGIKIVVMRVGEPYG